MKWKNDERKELLLEVMPRADLASHFGGDLDEKKAQMAPIPWVFVIQKKPEREAAAAFRWRLSDYHDPVPVLLENLELHGEAIAQQMKVALFNEGLTEPEATALLRTFERDFFATPGVRVISILPRCVYDWALPLKISPKPGEIVRVGLIWKECGSGQ